MEKSITNPILTAIKRRSPNLSCELFNTCTRKSNKLSCLLPAGSLTRNKRYEKKHQCIFENCISGNEFVKKIVDMNWVKPIEVSSFWESIKDESLTLENNLFVFTSRFFQSTIDPMVDDLIDDGCCEGYVMAFARDHKNTLSGFFFDKYLFIVLINDKAELTFLKFDSFGTLIEFTYSEDEKLNTKRLDEVSTECIFETPKDKDETLLSLLFMTSVLRIASYIRVEGSKIESGGMIANNSYRTFYNDTPYDIIIY